jgi:hypothetical protein
MNAEVKDLLERVIVQVPTSICIKGLVDVADDEKKLVVYVFTRLKTRSTSTLIPELKKARSYLSFYESGVVLKFFLDLVTKYPSLKEFVPVLLNEVVLA